MQLTCFKAYDVRGRLGSELNPAIAHRIARGFAQALGARRIVVGRDCRESSAELMAAAVQGLVDEGVEVLDLGLCGTEEMYFATTHFEACGGLEVTASHNPMDYNGMKLVQAGSAPLGGPTDLSVVRARAERDDMGKHLPGGTTRDVAGNARAAYVHHVVGFVDETALTPLKILVNSGNGTAGPTFDAIAGVLCEHGSPLDFVRMHHEPDSTFPNGIPNPLLPDNQPATAAAVVASGADFGVAWDGDFDRCFLFDHLGRFVPGEYVVGLLAEAFLAKTPGASIAHDPRVLWNTADVIDVGGGTSVLTPTGHVYFKRALRETGAVYGGEMSAHHYFRDFMCCDSGMIPWLLVAELLGRRGATLADLLADRIARFPSSGEINFRLADPDAAVMAVLRDMRPEALAEDRTDGISLAFADWRLNLRRSNTEPLLRLNVEARGNAALVDAAVARVQRIIAASQPG